MPKKRPGFILYHEDLEIVQSLTDAQLGRIVRMIYAYSTEGEEQKPSPELALAYALFKTKVVRDELAYEKRCRRNKQAAESRWQNETEPTTQEVYNTDACERMQTHANGCEVMRSDAKHANGNGNGNGNGKYIIPPTTVNNNNTKNNRARAIPDGCVVGECASLIQAAEDVFAQPDDALSRALSLLAENYGAQPLYRATVKAVDDGTPNVRDIRNILETWRQTDAARDAFEHEDVRRAMK